MNSTRHFILGLLSQRPMSGYDIKRYLNGLNWLVGSPSFGTLYPALHALVENGMAVVDVVPATGKPPRNVYSITRRGHQALREWIALPPATEVSMKGFVMRLLVADALPTEGLIATLDQRRATVAAHGAAMREAASVAGDDVEGLRGFALEYGLAVADAELAWLNKKLGSVPPPTASDRPETGNGR